MPERLSQSEATVNPRRYCPKCGRTIRNGYHGSVCYCGGRSNPPIRMKSSGGGR